MDLLKSAIIFERTGNTSHADYTVLVITDRARANQLVKYWKILPTVSMIEFLQSTDAVTVNKFVQYSILAYLRTDIRTLRL